MKARKIIWIAGTPIALLFLFFLGYSAWNSASPERSCGSCHEIVPSMEIWQRSAHREVGCSDCHGTALGNGFHSLKEKGSMLVSHLKSGNDPIPPEPGLNEEGVLEVMQACVKCHRDEHEAWKASGHAASYADIFLDERHNSMERPYPDCFRCHGMYYDGTIADLVEPISTSGPWKLKDESKATDPVIPCLSCHPIHMENLPMNEATAFDDPDAIYYERSERHSLAGLYLRSDKMHLRSDLLPKPVMHQPGMAHQEDGEVLVSDDPLQRLCMQCHAPNWAHEVGTEDDHTPSGVHEGISCRACHRGHSNDPRKACLTCHPALSNCGQDVMQMNTTYRDRESPNDIHRMTCTNCHDPIPLL